MNDKKTIINTQFSHFIDGQNLVTYKCIHKNIKNTYLRYEYANKLFVVTTNKYISDERIEDFVKANYQNLLNKFKAKSIDEDIESISIFGNKYQLKIIKNKTNDYELINNTLYLKLSSLTAKSKTIRKFISENYSSYLINRTLELASKLNLNVKKVETKWFNGRWGHCSKALQSITLSLQLIRFEKNIIDSIIYHELAHLVYADHQVHFKRLWSQWCPNCKPLCKQLNHFNDY